MQAEGQSADIGGSV